MLEVGRGGIYMKQYQISRGESAKNDFQRSVGRGETILTRILIRLINKKEKLSEERRREAKPAGTPNAWEVRR